MSKSHRSRCRSSTELRHASQIHVPPRGKGTPSRQYGQLGLGFQLGSWERNPRCCQRTSAARCSPCRSSDVTHGGPAAAMMPRMKVRSERMGDAPAPQACHEPLAEGCLVEATAVGPDPDNVTPAPALDMKLHLQLGVHDIELIEELTLARVLAQQLHDGELVIT